MHPNIAVLLSVACYATAAVILEQHLSRFSAPLMVATVGAAVCVLGLLTHFAQHGPGPLIYPTGAAFTWLMIACVCWYFADTFYVVAYTNGGNLYTITTLGMLFVPTAALVRFLATHEPPTRYHVLAYAIGCVMVWLTVYGNQQIGK